MCVFVCVCLFLVLGKIEIFWCGGIFVVSLKFHDVGKGGIDPGSSKVGSWVSSIDVTWELLKMRTPGLPWWRSG